MQHNLGQGLCSSTLGRGRAGTGSLPAVLRLAASVWWQVLLGMEAPEQLVVSG